MPNITYDPQSFIIDGRRIWLVSGSMNYARTPHQLWRRRIRAARQAGLNCITTPVLWNLHEPQAGRFRFDGDADLRRFIETIGEEGMYCILRIGPFVGDGADFGGLPPWLLQAGPIPLREAHPTYMAAVARYLDAIMQQVRDLQITAPKAGPLVLIQNEHRWQCHNDDQADQYLVEINRYLRENGGEVPILNANNLWQQVPNTIDTWAGESHLRRDARQLRIAQPDAPRLISELSAGAHDRWGAPHEPAISAHDLSRRMAEVASAGAQANLHPFHGGTGFAFRAGRSGVADDGEGGFLTTTHDSDAPLREAGGRGAKFLLTKRIATFLTQFGAILAQLKPSEHHAVVDADDKHLSIAQQTGPMGEVVFITRNPPFKAENVTLTTPLGQAVPVHLGRDAAAWLLLNANLDGKARLDLTNLRPWAFLGSKLLVLFGPSGTDALVAINGAILADKVPTGAKPLVKTLDETTVAILNEKQVDAAYIHPDGRLFVGIAGFNEENEPIRGGSASASIVEPDGRVRNQRLPAASKPTAPRLTNWASAETTGYVDGSAARFAAIEGPRALEQSGADYGYGWYRLSIKLSAAKHFNLLAPEAADRLHLYLNGKLQHVIGDGPGASRDPVPLKLPAGEHQLVCLADNLGRFADGPRLGDRKGLFGPLRHVKAVRLAKPERQSAPMVDPFALRGFVPGARRGDRALRPRFTFTVTHRKRTPLILDTYGDRPRSVVLVNDQPIAIDSGRGVAERLILEPGQCLKQGQNRITFALIDEPAEGYEPARGLTVYEVLENVGDKAAWAYARWQMPDETRFEQAPKTPPPGPAWHRAHFRVKDPVTPLWLEISGMSKGQVYLNGHNVGRFFVATATGRKVPPQTRYYLPEPWLTVDETNELILFDEHGRRPDKCRLVYDPMGPFGD